MLEGVSGDDDYPPSYILAMPTVRQQVFGVELVRDPETSYDSMQDEDVSITKITGNDKEKKKKSYPPVLSGKQFLEIFTPWKMIT